LSLEATRLLLPALWDEVDEVSPALRVAYMDVITTLWRDNFSRQIGRWCEEHGVLYIGHNVEDRGAHMHTGWGCGHYFRSMAGQHMAGVDIVLNQMTPGITAIKHAAGCAAKQFDPAFYQYTLAKLGASLAHITPHMNNRAFCEVFGAYGWTLGLPLMRSILNHFMANGINYFVPHSYSMILPEVYRKQPPYAAGTNLHAPPGYTSGDMPPSFHAGGFNPQHRIFGNLMRYTQRVCHLISDGVHMADVAVYYNAEPDWQNCAHRGLDDVTLSLTRSGFDFDLIPADTLYRDCTVANNRLVVNRESYGALVLPMAEILPLALLQRLDELAAQGLKIIFTDRLPTGCEYSTTDIRPWLTRLEATTMPELSRALDAACGKRLQVNPWDPALRFYGLEKADGTALYVFYNEGNTTLDTWIALSGCVQGTLYDPWTNKAYRAAVSEKGLRLRLEAQQLLVVLGGDADKNLPAFIYDPPPLRVLPLRYDIYVRDAGDNGDSRLLRANSEAVNLTVAEGLTRYCGEFRYKAQFHCSDPTATVLEIPYAGDCAELWLNGSYCGSSLGRVCRFDISGKLRAGQNMLTLLTADNPSYCDRGSTGAFWGAKLPVAPHGFVGDILIG